MLYLLVHWVLHFKGQDVGPVYSKRREGPASHFWPLDLTVESQPLDLF
jgi:hypothetical protein